MNIIKTTYTFIAAFILFGCAGTNSHDPYERYNRKIHAFNESVDKAFIKPVAKGYQAVTPKIAQQGIGNALSNLAHPKYMVHDILQGNPKEFLEHSHRFLINSTFGIAGIFDLTTPFKLPAHQSNDMGITFARYGWKNSNYFILPLLGPGTVRDSFGRFIDIGINPYQYYMNAYASSALLSLSLIHLRAQLLDLENVAKKAALDAYVFQRETFMQFRHNQLYQRGYVSSKVPIFSDEDEDEPSILDLARDKHR